jgi:hypothetical protein
MSGKITKSVKIELVKSYFASQDEEVKNIRKFTVKKLDELIEKYKIPIDQLLVHYQDYHQELQNSYNNFMHSVLKMKMKPKLEGQMCVSCYEDADTESEDILDCKYCFTCKSYVCKECIKKQILSGNLTGGVKEDGDRYVNWICFVCREKTELLYM